LFRAAIAKKHYKIDLDGGASLVSTAKSRYFMPSDYQETLNKDRSFSISDFRRDRTDLTHKEYEYEGYKNRYVG